MKKTVLVLLMLLILLIPSVYAFESALVNIRNKIFTESQEIKTLLTETKDVILVNSIWDSCIMAVSQLDAYFSLVGIFNTIKKAEVTEQAIKYLTNWLKEIKNTNGANIKSLESMTITLNAKTKLHVERLKEYFKTVNNQIDADLAKISLLVKSLGIKKPAN